MAVPKTGTAYRYTGEHALGHAARLADPDVDETKPTPDEQALGAAGYAPGGATHPQGPRAALDLHPDQTVKIAGYDEERDLILVEWADANGDPRITSITPDQLASNFTRGA